MNTTQKMVEKLYSKLNSFLKTETVIGEPITVGSLTLIPIITAYIGLGGGAWPGNKKNDQNGGGGGAGCQIAPSGILVIKDDQIEQLIPLEEKGSLKKISDMFPELISILEDLNGQDSKKKHEKNNKNR